MGPYAGVDPRYVHSRVDANTFTMGNPMPESTLTLCQSRLYPHSGILDLASGSGSVLPRCESDSDSGEPHGDLVGSETLHILKYM
jgi:hypothetical protein